MDYSFEQEKNLKALAITTVITVVLFMLFFYVHYTKPVAPEIPAGEGIEVNLGESETGLGATAPEISGSPAKENENLPVQQASPAENATTPDAVQPSTNPSEEDVAVNHPLPSKKITPNIKPNIKPIIKPSPKNTTAPVLGKVAPGAAPIPVAKPKALFKNAGSTGNGGNNADSYNRINNQGISSGKGDQGNPNGNPNSDSYTGNAASGNGGAGGVSIRSGLDGRRITRLPSFEDDFNENAKVAVDITVDQSGNVITASINPKGTTTGNTGIRNIALQKARSLKLNSGKEEEQTGTLIFNFKLRN